MCGARAALKALLITGLATLVSVAVEPRAQAFEPFPRTEDAIIVRGERIERLLGLACDRIAVFADKGRGLEAVPYQIDERRANGEFVLTSGPRPVADEDHGLLDANDEIVFLARDLGRRVLKNEWQAASPLDGYEIEVRDPLTGRLGYGYAFAFDHEARRSPWSYLSYDMINDLAKGETYELGFVDSVSGLDYDYLAIRREAGGSGRDILDRLKVRVLLSVKRAFVLGLPLRIDRTEENFSVKLYGYKVGPVRVIRTVKTNLLLIWKLPAPGATVNAVFYPRWIEWPVPINLPFRPAFAFYKMELDISHDFDLRADGSTKVVVVSADGRRKEFVVDGKMSEGEREANRTLYRDTYFGFMGPAGAGFYTVRMSPSWKGDIMGIYSDHPANGIEPGYCCGDGEKKDRPENLQGASPLAGGRFVNLEALKAGTHTMLWYHFYPAHYRPGAEKPYLDIINHPLEITTR